MLEHFVLFIISFFANLLSSLAGGGAGLLQLPALLFLGLPFGIALATHKIASVALGVGASIKHLRVGQFDLMFAGIILATGLPGVIIGAWWVLDISEALAQILLGVLTTGLGVYSIFKPKLGQEAVVQHRTLKGYCVGGSGLFLIGVMNGSLTSGTGLFVGSVWITRQPLLTP